MAGAKSNGGVASVAPPTLLEASPTIPLPPPATDKKAPGGGSGGGQTIG